MLLENGDGESPVVEITVGTDHDRDANEDEDLSKFDLERVIDIMARMDAAEDEAADIGEEPPASLDSSFGSLAFAPPPPPAAETAHAAVGPDALVELAHVSVGPDAAVEVSHTAIGPDALVELTHAGTMTEAVPTPTAHAATATEPLPESTHVAIMTDTPPVTRLAVTAHMATATEAPPPGVHTATMTDPVPVTTDLPLLSTRAASVNVATETEREPDAAVVTLAAPPVPTADAATATEPIARDSAAVATMTVEAAPRVVAAVTAAPSLRLHVVDAGTSAKPRPTLAYSAMERSCYVPSPVPVVPPAAAWIPPQREELAVFAQEQRQSVFEREPVASTPKPVVSAQEFFPPPETQSCSSTSGELAEPTWAATTLRRRVERAPATISPEWQREEDLAAVAVAVAVPKRRLQLRSNRLELRSRHVHEPVTVAQRSGVALSRARVCSDTASYSTRELVYRPQRHHTTTNVGEIVTVAARLDAQGVSMWVENGRHEQG